MSTSSHHCRNVVGVVDPAVRGSASSRPLFFASNMSTSPCAIPCASLCAIPSLIPKPVMRSFSAAPVICR
ncbi:hypothetical protein [Streptomyces sp. NPDC056660]|uniref:hypothetical protein n=1 Tax=Streptomyces sp. NPDC056660 TaxID=3345897 RepID=UPI00369FCC6E